MNSTTGELGKAPPPAEPQAAAARPVDTPSVNEASARVTAETAERQARDGHDAEATAVLRKDAEGGDAGKPLVADRAIAGDTPMTESPQTTRGSAGGPPQPEADAQRSTVIDATGQARPDLTPPGGTSVPQGDLTALARPGAATFPGPGPAVHNQNGPIWRHATAHGSLEVGLLDGLLYISIHPNNGRAASMRLPAAASLELRVALARTDLR